VMLVMLLGLGVISSESIGWFHVEVTGNVPDSRSEHVAVLKKSTREMIVFGGLHMYQSLKDTFVFNIDKSQWRELITSGNNPPPIRKHTGVISEDEKYMIIFGGVDDDGVLYNSLYVLDLDTNVWTVEHPKGDIPVPRVGHTADMIPGNKMIIFGGNSDKSMLNDVHVLDITKKTWTEMKPGGDIPVARTGTVGTITNNYFYIFGGIKYYGDINGYLNDVYRYDFINNKWQKIDAEGKIDPRANYCSITSANGNYMILHGYWKLHESDSVFLDCKSNHWESLDVNPSSSSIPLGRSHATAITLNHEGTTKVYLFGGNDGVYENELGFRNDIWIAQGSGF